MAGRIFSVIAHRLSTIEHADRIVVMQFQGIASPSKARTPNWWRARVCTARLTSWGSRRAAGLRHGALTYSNPKAPH